MKSDQDKPKGYKVYVTVSNDEYELPEMVCDSIEELAEKNGVTVEGIKSMISKYQNGKLKFCKYRVIFIS